MVNNMAITGQDAGNLAAEREALRIRLNNQIETASRLREDYNAECRQLAHGDDAKILAAKQNLDVAESRVEGIRAEICEKERLLDEIQGREAEDNRRQQLQRDFEVASERLAASQAEISNLKTEYLKLPEKIRTAEWNFHKALKAFNEAKAKFDPTQG